MRAPIVVVVSVVIALAGRARAQDVAAPAEHAIVETPTHAPAHVRLDDDRSRRWHDFELVSDDGAHELRFIGIVQSDARLYLEPGDAADTSTFFIRRARLYAEGHVFDAFEYRLMLDFAQLDAPIVDAFVGFHFVDWLQLRVGRFKQPFSYEQFGMEDLTQAAFERSMLDQLVPARNVGAMIFGREILGGTLEYYLAVANGGQRDGNIDSLGQGFDGLGRIALRPFALLGGYARNLMLGVGATFGEQHGNADPMRFQTPLRTTFFALAPGTTFDGMRWRVSPEIMFCVGPWGFVAQYLRMEEPLRAMGSPTPHVLGIDAYYAMTTLVLTGERRDHYAQFIDPREPLDPITGRVGPGAWELILRTSGLRVTGDAAPLLASAQSTTSAYEITVGLNWYMSRRVWIQLNYERAFWSTPIALGVGAPQLWAVDNASLRATIQW